MTRSEFQALTTMADLQRVNDAQKRLFQELAAADPTLINRRLQAYARRWQEALVQIPQGATLLDIGCGWLPEAIFQRLTRGHQLNYHCMDIDAGVIDDMRAKLAQVGLPVENAQQGDNTTLPYPDAAFDAVFSSHCLEHSIDIARTLQECRRVLRPGGQLILGVPLGFDDSAEHTLFLGPDEWDRLLTLSGFEVVSRAIGRTYVETGDLVLLAERAERAADLATGRELAARFSKADTTLVRAASATFRFPAGAQANPDATIMRGVGAVCEVRMAGPCRALVIVRHAWSGMILLSDGQRQVTIDAYAPLPYLHGLDVSTFAPCFSIEVIGANPLAADQQVAVVGALMQRPPV